MTAVSIGKYAYSNNVNNMYYHQPDVYIEISDDENELPAQLDVEMDEELIDVVSLDANNTESMEDIDMQLSTRNIVPTEPSKINYDETKLCNEPTILHPQKIQPQHICVMCNTMFTTAKKLNNHMRPFVESKNQAALKCNFCQQLKCSLRRLKEHVAEQHKNSRYECGSCPKTYVNLTSFETHKIVAHRNTSLYSPSPLSRSSPTPPIDAQNSPQMVSLEWYLVNKPLEHRSTIKLQCPYHPLISHCICRLTASD